MGREGNPEKLNEAQWGLLVPEATGPWETGLASAGCSEKQRIFGLPWHPPNIRA